MKEIKIKDDFIKLCKLLKLAGLVSSGVEAKIVINEGEVLYNGEVEFRRGKKVYKGDTVEFDNEIIKVI